MRALILVTGLILVRAPTQLLLSQNEGFTGEAVRPVLSFPEPGLDDTAAYQGYQTRFYRDSKDNPVQIYLQPETPSNTSSALLGPKLG
jgi:hypothetical protein